MSQDSAVIDGTSASFKLKVKGAASPGIHDLSFVAVDAAGHKRQATLSLDIQ
ncbi:MAG TPA: hypothetical protein VFV34_17160 [Blastocatellia bacterium]|nr:hypothetical protein [Blastocatellia bacterium]